ncbi:SAV_915 family protein [Streptomyces sp. P1-3]|uniref:SAV_915 family protein n=1 Tax=Streptomyces sp. P1-3 TaxID=3421658 RepID=UPI003D36A93F
MAEMLYGDDPEPSDRFPAGPLYVPVRSGPAGCAARLFRTPLGGRTAVGFTTERRLIAVLGPEQAWIRLAECALRALAEPLGVGAVTVDPQFAAPAASPSPAPSPTIASSPAPARPAIAASPSPAASSPPPGAERPWHGWDPRGAEPPAPVLSAPAGLRGAGR